MRPLLVLRPEPGAAATVRRAEARGFKAIAAPLFAIEPVAWVPPAPEDHDALFVTSANAARAAGSALARFRGLPAYAVGAATAAALHTAGFADVIVGARDAGSLIALLRADGRRAPLHLAGEDFRAFDDAGVTLVRVTVYRTRLVGALPDEAARALRGGAVALLHSPRAAASFAALVEGAGLSRDAIPIVTISAAAAAAAGCGWGACAIAAAPDDEALLAAAAALCEESGGATMWAG